MRGETGGKRKHPTIDANLLEGGDNNRFERNLQLTCKPSRGTAFTLWCRIGVG